MHGLTPGLLLIILPSVLIWSEEPEPSGQPAKHLIGPLLSIILCQLGSVEQEVANILETLVRHVGDKSSRDSGATPSPMWIQ